MSDSPARVPGWKRVLDAFLAAEDRTLTNAQLGAIPGVQAFHQRRSDLIRRGYVLTGAVLVKHGYYAYRLLGYLHDSKAAEDLAKLPANLTSMPTALAVCVGQERAEALIREGEAALRRAVAAGDVKADPRATAPTPDLHLEGEVARLRGRVAELEADLQHSRSEVHYLATGEESDTPPALPAHDGALYVVMSNAPGPGARALVGSVLNPLDGRTIRIDPDDETVMEILAAAGRGCEFVELENTDRRSIGADASGVRWSEDEDGSWLLGPFYAAPQVTDGAEATPRRHPRSGKPSGPALMRQALEALGRPAHTKVIAAHVLEHGGADVYKGKTPIATMGAQLATSNAKGGEFVKVAPGCFALREWTGTDKIAAEPAR